MSMKCPECDATDFAGFNGFVLCSPTDPAAKVHRMSNDQFNARLEAFESGELVETPKRRTRKPVEEPVEEPEPEVVPDPPTVPDEVPTPE